MKNTSCPPQDSDGAQFRASETASPSPSFIDANDRQPIPSTTHTHLGDEVGVYGATAFVFTSSRILRAIQDQEEEDSPDQCHSNASISSVPSTPSSPSMTLPSHTPLAQHTKTQRASLTLSQLDKHSEGAISARSLLGPNMRAAGFVDLPHSRASRPVDPSGAPSTSPHSRRALADPPPRNPPNFPPILFVKPSHVTTTPLWEYQIEGDSSFVMTDDGRIGLAFATSSSARPGEFEPVPRISGTSSSSLSSTKPLPSRPLSPPTHPGPDLSDPLSPPPSSTLLSSSSCPPFPMDQPSEHGGRFRPTDTGSQSRNGKAREWSAQPGELPLPTPRASPRSHPSARSRGSRASTATASPSLGIGGAIPPIARPSYSSSSSSSLVPGAPPGSTAASSSDSSTAVSSSTSLSRPLNANLPTTSSPQRRRRSSAEKLPKPKAKNKAGAGEATKAMPSFSSAKRLGRHRPYSFTELCDPTSFMWTSKSEMFAPPAPVPRSSNVAAIAPLSRPGLTAAAHEAPPPRPPRHPRRQAKGHGSGPQISGRAHLIASEPLRNMPMRASEPDSSLELDNEKARARKAKKMAKGGDGALIDKDTKRASKFLANVLPGVNTHDSSTVKKRGRDTRGKRLGASESLEDRAAVLV